MRSEYSMQIAVFAARMLMQLTDENSEAISEKYFLQLSELQNDDIRSSF